MAKAIMVQGTMSNAGKSLVTAGLCRIFYQDGYRVCPFKSQNMALNSYITAEGLEMGRAQVMQAEAAGIEPSVKMNPILLKPNSDTGSQIIVNGEVRKTMGAKEYYQWKMELLPDIMKSYHELEQEYDLIVIEGAGSPAEINLKEHDFVNMGMAKLADAPVILVGDIDRGGVFAQLYGTVKLLEKEEQERIKGLIINKFRGDPAILEPGLKQLEELMGIPVLGTIPYRKFDIDDEDSLSERLHGYQGEKAVNIAVIRTPRMSNFTDFAVFEQMDQVSLYYVDSVKNLKAPDMILLPGTKSTISDLLWLRQNGLESAIQKAAGKGTVIFGICGGYQMLGYEIHDPDGVEGGGTVRGMGLLPVNTIFEKNKYRTRCQGSFTTVAGPLEELSGKNFHGYELHHGRTIYLHEAAPIAELSDGNADGAQNANIYGSYIHGIFDEAEIMNTVMNVLLARKGMAQMGIEVLDRDSYKQQQYDILASEIRKHLDIGRIYQILGLKR